MELLLTLGGSIGLVAVAVAAVFWSVGRAPLDLVDHLVPDEGGRFLHIFGHRTLMPEDGDSFSVYHHLLLDLDTRKVHIGDKLRGEDLDLGSPFVVGSIEGLAKRLGIPLALGRRVKGKGKDVPMFHLKATHTATEKAKAPPPDGVIFWTLSDDPPRFDLELRRAGTTVLRRSMKGYAEGPFLKRHTEGERGLLFVTYLRQVTLSTGVALLVIDTRTWCVVSDEWLRTGR